MHSIIWVRCLVRHTVPIHRYFWVATSGWICWIHILRTVWLLYSGTEKFVRSLVLGFFIVFVCLLVLWGSCLGFCCFFVFWGGGLGVCLVWFGFSIMSLQNKSSIYALAVCIRSVFSHTCWLQWNGLLLFQRRIKHRNFKNTGFFSVQKIAF